MTHFRFRFKQVGYRRWRWRAAHRRTDRLVRLFAVEAGHAARPGRRRSALGLLGGAWLAPAAAVLRVGGFEVGEAGDPQLLGHPDIRY